MGVCDEKIVFESDLLDRDIDHIMNDNPIAHFTTPAIDKLVGGVKPRLVIISAEPGAGKTTMAIQMADELAEQDIPVLFFTFEIKRPLLVAKSISRISDGTLPIADISSAANEVLEKAVGTYATKVAGNIALIDKPVTTIDISALAGRVERELGIKPVIFLDYVQIPLKPPSTQSWTSARQSRRLVAGLRHVINGHDAPLFAVSSVNRSTYKKDSAGLDSLAESSSLEYATDTVLFLSVKGKGDERRENMCSEVRPVSLAALKNRYGTTRTVDLLFDTRFATFHEA